MRQTFLATLVVLAALLAACSSSSETADTGTGADAGAPADTGVTLDAGTEPDAGAADAGTDAGEIAWNPGLSPTSMIPPVRGYQVARTIIHAHNIYSHDGCDSKPWIDPADPAKVCDDWWLDPACVPDEQCVGDLRAALCTLNIDALFLTDHRGTLAHEENFDNLYVQRTGDTWVEEGGVHTGSQQHCTDGHVTTLMVGSENDAMPIGITAHPPGDEAARSDIYGSTDAAAFKTFHDLGGLVAQQHSEGSELSYLRSSAIDLIEIYNFHVSMIQAAAYLADYMGSMDSKPPADLQFMGFYAPLMEQLTKWYGTVYERAVAPFIGTDIHRNTIPKLMPDGERLDSYRRFMRWFSNHLLVTGMTPAAFKDALRNGRTYVVAEGIGTPAGFDFYAETSAGVKDLGQTIEAALAPKLIAKKPHVVEYPGTAADVRLVLKKIADQTAEVVKESAGDLEAEGLAPGVYYVEAAFTPNYLRPLFKSKRVADQYVKEFTWIYSSAIRIK